MRRLAAVLSISLILAPVYAQNQEQGSGLWQQQASGTDVQLRGVSAVSHDVIWASGAKGTVLRTVDGGEHWEKVNVPNAEALDFRDVQAFDAKTAFVLSIGPGEQSRIYKTADGGKTWQLLFTNKDPKAFYDCFAFWDSKHGIALSDSVDGKFPLITTSDGLTWNAVTAKNMPAALPNEGAFAASGTCIATFGKKDVWFGTGGPAARVFHSTDRGVNWTVAETPMLHGAASQGVFSVLFLSNKEGVVVGG
ncbi:MAG TPA: oxidoreductase, partial [Candidatus Angelobacter sp.]|nr:oxidoreductase [Candidatus Angelobacter sp.]